MSKDHIKVQKVNIQYNSVEFKIYYVLKSGETYLLEVLLHQKDQRHMQLEGVGGGVVHPQKSHSDKNPKKREREK